MPISRFALFALLPFAALAGCVGSERAPEPAPDLAARFAKDRIYLAGHPAPATKSAERLGRVAGVSCWDAIFEPDPNETAALEDLSKRLQDLGKPAKTRVNLSKSMRSQQGSATESRDQREADEAAVPREPAKEQPKDLPPAMAINVSCVRSSAWVAYRISPTSTKACFQGIVCSGEAIREAPPPK